MSRKRGGKSDVRSEATTHRLAREYLASFGYLDEEVKLGDALRNFQYHSALKPTGRLNKATLELIDTPRCGMPDMRRGYWLASRCRWNKAGLTFSQELGIEPWRAERSAAVRRAFGTWHAVGLVSFAELPPGVNSDIQVRWLRVGTPGCGLTGRVVAHADYPPNCTISNETPPWPLHFNSSNYRWAVNGAGDALDVETVALHEIGHILGLDHSQVAGSVMNRDTPAGRIRRQLTSHDIASLRNLYTAQPIA